MSEIIDYGITIGIGIGLPVIAYGIYSCLADHKCVSIVKGYYKAYSETCNYRKEVINSYKDEMDEKEMKEYLNEVLPLPPVPK